MAKYWLKASPFDTAQGPYTGTQVRGMACAESVKSDGAGFQRSVELGRRGKGERTLPRCRSHCACRSDYDESP